MPSPSPRCWEIDTNTTLLGPAGQGWKSFGKPHQLTVGGEIQWRSPDAANYLLLNIILRLPRCEFGNKPRAGSPGRKAIPGRIPVDRHQGPMVEPRIIEAPGPLVVLFDTKPLRLKVVSASIEAESVADESANETAE